MIDLSDRKQVEKKLNELKNSKLPHMNVERFSKLDQSFEHDILEATEEEKKIINDKLNIYYRPEGENKCVFMDKFPSLEWGLEHGVAIDSNTCFSWRQYHYFKINGKENKYVVSLQLHPDGYSIDE